jgi:hypothetical protein
MDVWTYTIIGPMVNVFLYAMPYAVGQWPVLGFWPSCLGNVKPELHGQCWPVLGSWPKFLVLEGWEEMQNFD